MHEGLYFEMAAGSSSGASAVVFIHGFPFNSAMWAGQVSAAQAMGLSTLVYDVRGLGRSSGDGQYTVESHVDDLFGLLDHLNLKNVIGVGLSMGGYILLRALEREPGRFKGAVLCDTKSEGDPNEVRLKRAENIKVVKEKGPAVFADAFIPGVFAPANIASGAPYVEQIRRVIAGQTAAGIAGNLLALASRSDTTGVLSKLSLPVLFLCGELDKTTPPSVMQEMQRLVPGSKMHLIARAAHMSNLENEGDFNARLVEFLKSCA
ncbi:MAG: alpha/beta fold hydrolase [Spirochaetia bacterium]|nr:alpha/beta fold hydrolase [Spirochaetia bacterium]